MARILDTCRTFHDSIPIRSLPSAPNHAFHSHSLSQLEIYKLDYRVWKALQALRPETIETELQGISDWAAKNNLALNYAKRHHIVIRRAQNSLETTS